MPNWCSSWITISRPAEEGGVFVLYDKIQSWIKEGTKIENSWGNDWLGLLVEKGLDMDPTSEKSYECRGAFYDLNLSKDGDEMTVNTETAWAPMMDLWFEICRKYIPGSQILYDAEEPGCGLYVTNNSDHEGTYYIDSWNDDIESIMFATEHDVRDVVERLQKGKISREKLDSMKINEVTELIDVDDNISINEWEYDYSSGVYAYE